MRVSFPFLAILLLLLVAAPAGAQKVDPLTGRVVEQAPPPAPAGPDLTAANDKVRAQDFAAAEALLAELQKEFPEDERVLAMRGELLVALARVEEAIPLLRKVAEMTPERPNVHFHLGTALASSGDEAGAIEAFGTELERSEEPQVRLLSHMNRSLLFQQGRQVDRPRDEHNI